MNYILYTDGATSNNGYENSFGGWAWALLNEKRVLLLTDKGRIAPATNNICEMSAIIEGCKAISIDLTDKDTVTVYSDSAYCINCYNQKWFINWQKNHWQNAKKQPVANRELWEQLIPFFMDKRFIFTKVKGHSNDEINDLVDMLAVEAKFEE